MSLGLNDPAPIGALAPEPRHKSAGAAFVLSVIIPGAGQFYCGKSVRGGVTLGFWVLGVVMCFSRGSTEIVGVGIGLTVVLWIFSFLDAYFTAIEINRGQDDQVDVQNPRVAVTLNLLTAGFGYFYLGERTKGITVCVAIQASRLLFLRQTGAVGTVISVMLVGLQLLMAADAYRIARRQLKEALGPEASPVAEVPAASRLPVQVPIAFACVIGFGFAVLAVIGMAMAGQGRKRPTNVALRRPTFQIPKTNAIPYDPDAPLVPAVDMPTAVQNIQQVQRKTTQLGEQDIPNLQRDVRVLSTALTGKKTSATDAMVAHYFRGVALSMINGAHYREGEETDPALGRMALADFDKVIAGGAVTAHTYVPAVSMSNAQYWAGIVERNHLRDEKAAFSYWEQCAGQGHGGCMHNVAEGHITGEGGEAVDFRQALDLYGRVFDTGTKFHCAGAVSAMYIAYVNYFTDVRRPGDDELEWAQKADGLVDKLEVLQRNRNECHRAEWEVNKFLLQLSHGHRDDNILQDGLSRLDDDSKATKALIQYIAGAIDESALESAVQADRAPGARCSAYFDAMWYAELHQEGAAARRYHQHLVEIGKFHCGEHLVFAKKFNL